MHLTDFVRAGNQGVDPELYEIENAAIDPDGVLHRALEEQRPWAGSAVVDLGCGSGFWLTHYSDAQAVIGVEPDPSLLDRARARSSSIEVRHGSAEQIPLADESVDLVHARFAYFFPSQGFDPSPGLAEVARVLRPGGALVVIDNDLERGEFAELLRRSEWAEAQGRDSYATKWWAGKGATTTAVMSAWQFSQREDLERVLHLEFPPDVARDWLRDHPEVLGLSYGYLLHTWVKPVA